MREHPWIYIHLIITPDEYEKLIKGEVIDKERNSSTYKYRIMLSSEVLEKLKEKENAKES